MPRLKSVLGTVAAAFVLIGGGLGGVQAADGGYNNMDAKSVYYDNGHDRENAAAMLAAVTESASTGYGRHKIANQPHAPQIVAVPVSHIHGGNLTADNSPLRR